MINNWFIYVLQSDKDEKLYIGISQDVTNRLKRHNMGLVRSTKGRRPFHLVGCKLLSSFEEARSAEVRLKAFKDPARVCAWITAESINTNLRDVAQLG